MKNFKDNLLAIFGFILLTIATFTYNDNIKKGEVNLTELIGIVSFACVVYIFLLFVVKQLFIKPKRISDKLENNYDTISEKYDEKIGSILNELTDNLDKVVNVYNGKFEEIYTEVQVSHRDLKGIEKTIKDATDVLVKKQQIIDQNILRLIEKQASEVWVVTTKLNTELGDKNLQADIIENFQKKPELEYIYFIPHPDSSFIEIQSNLKKFKKLDLYKQYQNRIEIIPLSIETQFLLEEVVIYNPTGEFVNAEKDKDYTGINGFTYYNDNGQKLHMKLDINMLRHLKSNLEKKLSGTGLTLAIEKVFSRFHNYLTEKQKIYLSNLLKEKSIKEKTLYNDFIKSFNDTHPVDSIQAILSKFINFENDK